MAKKFIIILAVLSVLMLGSSFSWTENAQAQAETKLFTGAGDISNCGNGKDEETANLLDSIGGIIFTLGDNAYPDGTIDQFNNCYGPSWGRHKNRTRPSPGNHDYHVAGAAGYYTYFGKNASPLDANCTSHCRGYYSFNLGAWHIIALDSEINHKVGSAQEQWLRADLAANQSVCTLAYWHHPRFSSGQHGNISHVQPFWDALYEYGADVVLNGHDHTYERFALQDPNGNADPNRGIRQFVVGTGGANLYNFKNIQPNSQVRNNTAHGVLRLALKPTSYTWTFIPVAGQTFTDRNTANCVNAGPSPTATPSIVRDWIFSHDFESGKFAGWSSQTTDAGDLSVSTAAALVRNNGMQAVIDDNKPIFVTDDRPTAEKRYRVRFYFDPNSIVMANGNSHVIFIGMGLGKWVLRMEFRQFAGEYQIRSALLEDSNSWKYTRWMSISDAPNYIELDWQAATGAGANNGYLKIWINGILQATKSGVDNDTRRIDRVQLGAVAGIDSGTRGTYYFDAFVSRRMSYIGPDPNGPAPLPTLTPNETSTPTETPTPTEVQSSTPTPTPNETSSSTSTPTETETPTETSTSTETPTAGASSTTRIVFAASNEDIANPERGFMKQSSIFPDQPFDTNKIRALQPTDTLVWVYFRLDNYRDRPLDQTALNTITSTFTSARNKGLKLVVRFVYNPGPGSTTDPNQANPDAPIDLVLQHISQLKPIIVSNADVIAVMQAGFVGHWGEWHSSTYLHPIEHRRAIVDALLGALPSDRMLQIRYPRYKEIFFQGPLTAQAAFTGSDPSRIGHHNDCFLRDQDDGGTYRSITAQSPKHTSTYCDGTDPLACWKGFIAQEGDFTPVGGETCQFNPPRTDCPNSLQEMAMLHWSFINNDYRREVLDGWVSGGCMETIRRSLGYRLVLKEVLIPQSIQAGDNLGLNIKLTNQGFASMFNPRPMYIVLQNQNNRYDIPIPSVDPRRWTSGREQTLSVNISLPANIEPGTYKLGLWLPDAYSSLRNKPVYAVRFANTNVWDTATGINILTTNFQVIP